MNETITDDDAQARPTAADRVRQTAQWITASFGAVAGALIVSLKLADINKLTGSGAPWALVGFGLAMAGVAAAIVAMAWVMEPTSISLRMIEQDKDLKRVAESDDWLFGFDSVGKLIKYYRTAAKEHVDTYQEMAKAAEAGKADELTAATIKHQNASQEIQLVNPAIERIVVYASDFKIMRKWHKALAVFVVGVAATSVGAAMFASQAAKPGTTVAVAPTRVTLDFTPAATVMYQERLGAKCNADSVAATALETASEATTVVVTERSCHPVELTLSDKDAYIQSVPLALPRPGAGPTPSNGSQ